jgi:hypothetical protein
MLAPVNPLQMWSILETVSDIKAFREVSLLDTKHVEQDDDMQPSQMITSG